MFRQFQFATAIAVALNIIGTVGSAEAHIGGRGGGIRLGGGLIPRARQGNAIGNRSGGNAGVARGATPETKAAVAPPVVRTSGTNDNSGTKPPVLNSSTKTNTPSTDISISNKAPESKTQSLSEEAWVPTNAHNGQNTATAQPTGLPSETKKPPSDAPVSALPANEIAPTAVASKKVALPQIPVGATVTLNCKDLSNKEGQVVLQIGEIALPATITEWKNNTVVCRLPNLGMTKASKATLHVLTADGKTASTMDLELVTVLPTSADSKPSSIDSARFGR
ncbi:hypothetical protein ETAA8_46270 [Anatilimnocola aggregata]|uniref:Ig-like domain-containing protein n=1 Tax=Anatilimnocola aggregata TaxID=2528021 RepID=A0A517YH03_9BACT|nr:hypothetical protein [Anatilimnocola aggregata]QDU29515.1 hypothetical protein ETAA8_46270 [Anatilimnocola aggregata]